MAQRVVLGRALSGGNPVYGLFVSRPGVNVVDGGGNLAATEDLLFDSRLAEQPNVLRSGTVSVTVPSGQTSVDSALIYHQASQAALDYIPVVLCATVTSGGQTLKQGAPALYIIGSTPPNPANQARGWYTRIFPIFITDTSFRIRMQTYGPFGGAPSDDPYTVHYWVLALGSVTPVAV